MKVKSIGSNMTEIETTDKRVLVSYSTPVAAVVDGKTYKTSTKWSSTTSRHISKWGAKDAEEKPQEFFDNLIK